MRKLTLFCLLLTFFALRLPQASASDIQLVTRSERANVGLDSAEFPDRGRFVSADGRFVVYESRDPVGDLDGNDSWDVLLFDRTTGETTLISHVAGDSERTGNNESENAEISADGSTVFFQSRATDLVSGFVPSAANRQLFAWHRISGSIRLVSHVAASQTTAGNGQVDRLTISADGAFVAFESAATDHIAGTDTNGGEDVFRWTRATGALQLVSRIAASPTTTGNGVSRIPSISADGQRVAFSSRASDMAPTDANGTDDVFLWDASSGPVTLVSQSTAGAGITGNAGSFRTQISADGSTVVFESGASDLVLGTDTPFSNDIFRWVVASGTLELISHVAGDPSTASNDFSFEPVISADGDVVAFTSRANDHVVATDGSDNDVFRWRSGSGVIELLSTPDGGLSASAGDCGGPRIGDDGSDVVFDCSSSDLVPGTDHNGTVRDVFLWRDLTSTVELVSRSFSDPSSSGEDSSHTERCDLTNPFFA